MSQKTKTGEQTAVKQVSRKDIIKAWSLYTTDNSKISQFEEILKISSKEQLELCLFYLSGYFSSDNKVLHLTTIKS